MQYLYLLQALEHKAAAHSVVKSVECEQVYFKKEIRQAQAVPPV